MVCRVSIFSFFDKIILVIIYTANIIAPRRGITSITPCKPPLAAQLGAWKRVCDMRGGGVVVGEMCKRLLRPHGQEVSTRCLVADTFRFGAQ